MRLGDVYVEVKGDTTEIRTALDGLKKTSDIASTGMTDSWKKVGIALVTVTVAAEGQKNAIEAIKGPAEEVKKALDFQAETDSAMAYASSMEVVLGSEKAVTAAVEEGEKGYADYLKGVEKREKAVLDASKVAIKAEETYKKAMVKSADEAYKAHKEKMKERAEAGRILYKDLEGFEANYYEYSNELIQLQAQRYRDLGLDQAAIAAWVAEEERKAWRDRTLASNDFFAGMRVGFQDMEDAQATWAERGKELFEDLKTSWDTAVGDMYDAFAAGEDLKTALAEITGDLLAEITKDYAKKAWVAAIDSIIGLIGALIGQLFAGAGGWGAVKAGATGAAVEVGIAVAATGVAMAAAKSQASKFKAEGGWIGDHPYGGLIQEGSGIRDDVFLGQTPGMRHWAMGGEFVINKFSTAAHRDLIELINRDKGMATGGYLDRGYKEGAALPWAPVADRDLIELINRDKGMATGGYLDRGYKEGGPAIPWVPIADMLAMGAGGSFLHGLYKGGGVYSAIADAIRFFAIAVVAMFTGKAVADAFKAEGGMIDVGYGFPKLPKFPKLSELPKLPGVPTPPVPPGVLDLDDILRRILPPGVGKQVRGLLPPGVPDPTKWLDPEYLWEKTLELIRVPLEAVAKDLVTPHKYYSNPIDTIINLLENIDLSVPHPDLPIPFLQQGGILPRTGLFYGHEGERVLDKEETVKYEKGDETVHNYFYINAVDAKSFEELCRRNPQAIIGPLTESAMRGRGFRTLIKEMR